MDVSKRATANLNVLHGKLDRKETIEQKNLSTLNTFKGFVESKVETLKSSLDTFIEEQNIHIDGTEKLFGKRFQYYLLYATFGHFIENNLDINRKLFNSIDAELTKLENGFVQKMNSFEEKLNDFCREKIEFIGSFDKQTSELTVK